MKKSSKILGSVALSAALVMGTAAPAFADTPTSANINMPTDTTASEEWKLGTDNTVDLANTDANANGSSTIVTVSTYTSQLNVTVPLYLPVWLDTVGGAAVAPSKGAYYIQNGSPIDISVTNAFYKNITGEANHSAGLTMAATPSNGGAMGTDTYNLSLTPDAGTVLNLNRNEANGTNVTLDWTVAKDNSKLEFTVAGQSGPISHSINNARLASIIYTVSAGSANTQATNGLGAGYNTPVAGPANPAQAIAAASMQVSEVKALFGANVKIVDASGSDLSVQDTDNVKISKVERWSASGESESDAIDVSANTSAPNTTNYVYKVTCATV